MKSEYREPWGCRFLPTGGDPVDVQACIFSVTPSGALLIQRLTDCTCDPELVIAAGGWTMAKVLYVDGKP